jgi:hypothetical protein
MNLFKNSIGGDMKKIKIFGLVIIVILVVSGCNRPHLKTISIDDSAPSGISVDARQRLVIVTDKGGPEHNQRVICAEPSPDAFLALAASGKADVAFAGKEIGAQAAIAQKIGAIGKRTQTIQLLRDSLYRACEAYMNGVIEKNEYRRIMAAYDELLITLVAVESLGKFNLEPLPEIGTNAIINESENGANATANAAETSTVKNIIPITIDPETTKSIQAIVRDYYCFQLGMKELFLRNDLKKSDNNLDQMDKKINEDVLNALCTDR